MNIQSALTLGPEILPTNIPNIVYFIFFGIILTISGIYLVKSLSKISRFLGISEFSAAFIIMAIATSLPELLVGISAATAGNSALSLGNVIGANILNLTIVTGIIILMGKEIKTQKKVGKDIYFMLLAISLIIILYLAGSSLSRLDGVILLLFFFFNSYRILKKRKKYPKKTKDGNENNKRFLALITFLIALVFLFISSNFVVTYASAIAIDFNFPQIIIGLFLISFATTLPELVFGVISGRLKHGEMGIGNQTGSVIVNSTLVLGIVSLIHPIKVATIPFLTSAIFMFIVGFIFLTFAITGRKLEKIEGVSLILIYVLFIIIELFIK